MNKTQRVIILLTISALIKSVSSVPPIALENNNNNYNDEINNLKYLVKNLSGHIEKWNRLFLNSVEPRLSSTISTIASIDSNIHNLQERAHVWDTFQLHVTAWNDQLASLDRKADIINKGQEKLTAIENKFVLVTNMEYKIDNVLKRLEKLEETLSESSKKTVNESHSSSSNHDILFGEFATRGILSSIKSIERKTDKLLLTNQNILLKHATTIGDEKPNKLTIKCNTPKNIEELLNDMSSKVDIIFDKISEIKDENEETTTDYESEYFELQSDSSSGEVPPDLKIDSDGKVFKKLLKRLNQPCKKNNQILEELLSRTLRIENTTRIILDAENTNFEFLSNQPLKTTYNISDNYFVKLYNQTKINHESIFKKLNDFNKTAQGIFYKSSNLKNTIILDSYFSEQRAHLESLFLKKFNEVCKPYKRSLPIQPNYEETQTVVSILTTTEIDEPTTTITEIFIEPTTTQFPFLNINNETFELNKTSCEDLDHDRISGVFIFNNVSEIESTGERFNKRYCEIRNDGLWTVIQRRGNYKSLENFTMDWEKYKLGFGDLMEDFWFGNENLFIMSNKHDLILRVELEDFEGNQVWAEYSTFKVMSEVDKYRLIIDGYIGNATDSLISHNNSFFSTFDRKNDEAPACCPCAVSYGGGWWFNRCFESNLNGVYYRTPNENEYFRGIIWEHWLGNYSLKKTEMMVKSKGKVKFSRPQVGRNETIKPLFEEP